MRGGGGCIAKRGAKRRSKRGDERGATNVVALITIIIKGFVDTTWLRGERVETIAMRGSGSGCGGRGHSRGRGSKEVIFKNRILFKIAFGFQFLWGHGDQHLSDPSLPSMMLTWWLLLSSWSWSSGRR
jgi:hypothetical protein